MNLVSVDDARQHLRLDSDSSGGADDEWLAIFIPAISDAVLNWLKSPARAYVQAIDSAGAPVFDSTGEPVPALDSSGQKAVRASVRAAVLIELASVSRFREGDGDNTMPSHEGHGYALNRASTSLLAPLRCPTVS